MIPMPETYLPYADIRRCGLQVTFEMVDVDAAETAETAVSDACEMAQPLPINPASSILPSFTRNCSVMSSPQLGLTPSRLWVAPSTGWRFSLLRLFSVMIWVYSSFRFTGPSPF